MATITVTNGLPMTWGCEGPVLVRKAGLMTLDPRGVNRMSNNRYNAPGLPSLTLYLIVASPVYPLPSYGMDITSMPFP